jgi:hypothetical protein
VTPVAEGRDALGPYLRVGAQAERGDACDGSFALGQDPPVIRVEDSPCVWREGRYEIALLQRDLVLGAQMLDVSGSHVGDDTDRGPGDRGEGGDLATMVHPELHHDGAVRLVAFEQCERQPELVVEVASVLEAGCRHAQDGCAHLLRRRLPVASRDGDQGALESRSVARSQSPQGGRRVLHLHDGHIRGEVVREGSSALDDEARSTAGEGAIEERVGVVLLAPDRDEQLARRDAPCINRHAVKRLVLRALSEAASAPTHGVARAEGDLHASSRRSSARRASTRSSKGKRSRPTI